MRLSFELLKSEPLCLLCELFRPGALWGALRICQFGSDGDRRVPVFLRFEKFEELGACTVEPGVVRDGSGYCVEYFEVGLFGALGIAGVFVAFCQSVECLIAPAWGVFRASRSFEENLFCFLKF